jgi:hypothetical protein
VQDKLGDAGGREPFGSNVALVVPSPDEEDDDDDDREEPLVDVVPFGRPSFLGLLSSVPLLRFFLVVFIMMVTSRR